MSEEKKYMFVVTACDGRHEHKHCDWEEAHYDAARWLDKDAAILLLSHEKQWGREMWEGPDGQTTRVELVGAYDALMKAEFGDDDD